MQPLNILEDDDTVSGAPIGVALLLLDNFLTTLSAQRALSITARQ